MSNFVYERPIPKADFEKYGIRAIDDLFNRFICGSGRYNDWVIDREREIYLRKMTDNGREHAESGGETPLEYYFTFYRHGLLMELGVCLDYQLPNPDTVIWHWWIGKGGLFLGSTVPRPEVDMQQSPELLADLKLALYAFSARPNLKPIRQVNETITIDF